MADPVIIAAPPDPQTELAATQARASAESAQEAAAGAIALSEVQAANVTEAASDRIASYEERLEQWRQETQAENATLRDSLSQAQISMEARMEASLAEIRESLSSMLTPPAPPQESPPNPDPASSAREELPSETPTEPPPEPDPPTRRKAHRWI